MISIKFDTDLHKDGLGAQLQRQVATFCLAQYLNVNFIPSEIKSLDFNPGDGITDELAQRELLTLVNKKLDSGEKKSIPQSEIINIKFANAPTKLWKLKIWFSLLKTWKQISRTSVIFVFDDPYLYINQNVNLYKKSKYFDFRLDNPFSNTATKINVALHIPRAKVSPTSLPERYQPTIWYVNVLKECIERIGVDRKFVNLYIHTDAPPAPTDWIHSGKSSLESQEYWKNAGIITEYGIMRLNSEDFLSNFSGYSSTEIIRDVSPIVAWANISHCDVFILGKSSFSFVGALLNKKGIMVSPNFFIKSPNNWVCPSDNCSFSIVDKVKLNWARLKIFKKVKRIEMINGVL